MTKREQRAIVKKKRKQLFLDTWHREKSQGASLSQFCRDYGLNRKNFYFWLHEANQSMVKSPIRRVDPAMLSKAIEIFFRYKGTWSAETISMALGRGLSAGTIRKAIRPYKSSLRCGYRQYPAKKRCIPKAQAPNHIWAIDWTQYRLRSGPAFIALVLDESARFFLGWEIFAQPPRQEDVANFLKNILARYQSRPSLLKSDRAKVFVSPDWRDLTVRHGIRAWRSRPHCPQDQGSIERAIREVKQWIAANAPTNVNGLKTCLEEGLFMLNFYKPKIVLGGKTPAAAYFAANPALAIPEACHA
jgi:putative transposase